MTIPSVHSVFLFVSDLERSTAFYQQVLGAAPAYRQGSVAAFDLGGVELMLHADGSARRVEQGSKRGEGFALHLRVEGVHALWDRLHEAGVQLDERPTERPYGVTEFAVHDPDGYEVEFVEPIATTGR